MHTYTHPLTAVLATALVVCLLQASTVLTSASPLPKVPITRHMQNPRRHLLTKEPPSQDLTTVSKLQTGAALPASSFSLNPSAGWQIETDGKLESKYHIAETHLLPKPRISTAVLLEGAKDIRKVIYLLSAAPTGNTSSCITDDAEVVDGISTSSNVKTGAGAITIQCEGTYNGQLTARDGAGQSVVIRDWDFEILRKDTSVPEYGPNGRGCVHGDPVDGVEMDGAFTCECEYNRAGLNCDVDKDLVLIAVPCFGIVGATLLVFGACRFNKGKHRRQRLGLARKAAEPAYNASNDELSAGLLAAVELGELDLVPLLIHLGADASVRGPSGELPLALALSNRSLQFDNPAHCAATEALLGAHCEFDAQVGACIRPNENGSKSAAHKLVEHALVKMATSEWRSPVTEDTVAHKILEGCITASLNERQTVQLMEAVLLHKPLLGIQNARGKTPTELAIMCEGKAEIQNRFTVVVFERYQIPRPGKAAAVAWLCGYTVVYLALGRLNHRQLDVCVQMFDRLLTRTPGAPPPPRPSRIPTL